MKVIATRAGYLNHRRYREGDEFEIAARKGKMKNKEGKLVDHVFTPEDQFSDEWMEKAEDHAPLKKVIKKPLQKPDVVEKPEHPPVLPKRPVVKPAPKAEPVDEDVI